MTLKEQFMDWWVKNTPFDFNEQNIEEDAFVRRAFYAAYRLGQKQGMEESANISDEHGIYDDDHLVANTCAEAIRQAAEEIRGNKMKKNYPFRILRAINPETGLHVIRIEIAEIPVDGIEDYAKHLAEFLSGTDGEYQRMNA